MANDYFSKSRTMATTHSSSIDMRSHIGLTLSSRTGYSWQAKQVFTFKARRQLCGTRDTPGGAPRTLYAVW